MEQKTKQESEVYEQMIAMLADQFYHQTGDNITINRMELADILTKQTMHGVELGKEHAKDYIEAECQWVKEDVEDGHDGYFQVRGTDLTPKCFV